MFSIPDLPSELQLRVLAHCDTPTLSTLCRVNRHFLTQARPLLWRDLKFDSLQALGVFFVHCSGMMTSSPQRWESLSRLVRTFWINDIPSFCVPETEDKRHETDRADWVFIGNGSPHAKSFYEVLACFENLEELRLYVTESVDFCLEEPEKVAQPIQGRLRKLRKLELGGNIPREVALAILSQPENIEELSCVNLQDGSAGQEYHSLGVVFLADVQERLINLKSLRLSKLADLGNPDRTGLLWDWDIDNDKDVLRDWAGCLQHVSKTLVELTFEDCFVGDNTHEQIMVNVDGEISDGEDSPWPDRGASSSRRFREIILPVLAGSAWSSLERLAFAGIHVGHRVLSDAGVLSKLGSGVEVHLFPITTIGFEYDVTPIIMSPPRGTCHKGLDAVELDRKLKKLNTSGHEGAEARVIDHSRD